MLSFENENGRTSHSTYYLPKVEIKDYNVMTDGKNFFDHPINSDLKTYENITKIATSQGDEYTTGCLLDYFYLNPIQVRLFWGCSRSGGRGVFLPDSLKSATHILQ